MTTTDTTIHQSNQLNYSFHPDRLEMYWYETHEFWHRYDLELVNRRIGDLSVGMCNARDGKSKKASD